MTVKKKERPFYQKVIYFCCFAFLIGAFIFLGTRNYTVKELPDNQLFVKEFKNIPLDNSFIVLNSIETLTFLERETGILFLGFPENEWSGMIAEMLDTASKEAGFGPIYYFNFYEEREKRHDNYLGIIREIDENLIKDDKGKLDLHAPTVLGIIHGEVVFYDDETSFSLNVDNPKSYWTEEKKMKKIAIYKQVFERIRRS